MENLTGFKATKQSGKLKVESGKLNVYKSDKSDKCISKSSQINILPKQHNVKDLSDLSDLSYISDFKKKVAFTLAEVGSISSPNQGRLGGVLIPTPTLPNQGGSKRKCAFTLAEVLVALGVIGVIASMTLPSVIQNYQKQRTVSQLKKAYTVMAQALKMSILDNDELKNWDVENFPNSKDYVEKFFKPYLKTIKMCNTPSECGYKILNGSRDVWACYNSTGTATCLVRWYPNGKTALVLPDGVHVIFQTIDDYGNAITSPSRSIYVDINGSKGPNAHGKDLFVFAINNKGLFPSGYTVSEADLKSNCSKDGFKFYCTAKIVKDGWKISDDYPW